jgi:hypothetical protein
MTGACRHAFAAVETHTEHDGVWSKHQLASTMLHYSYFVLLWGACQRMQRGGRRGRRCSYMDNSQRRQRDHYITTGDEGRFTVGTNYQHRYWLMTITVMIRLPNCGGSNDGCEMSSELG